MIGTEVQKAIIDALKAAPAVAGGNVFDEVPGVATGLEGPFPRVTIGNEQIVDDGNSCDNGWEVFAQIDIWTRSVGFPEAKSLQAAIVPRILNIQSISGHTLIAVELERSDSLRDPDGKTRHVAMTFRFLINPA